MQKIIMPELAIWNFHKIMNVLQNTGITYLLSIGPSVELHIACYRYTYILLYSTIFQNLCPLYLWVI